MLSDSVDVKKPAIGAFSSPARAERRAGDRETKKICKDPTYRRRYLQQVMCDTSIIRSVPATLIALLDHSDDTGKPAWPSEERLAKVVGVDVRTIRRHLAELRDAEYLLVYVSPPVRDKATGRYSRKQTNRYYFIFCKESGHGRRVMRTRRSRLQDTGVPLNPIEMSNPRLAGVGGGYCSGGSEKQEGCRDQNRATTTPSAASIEAMAIIEAAYADESPVPDQGWAPVREQIAATRALLKKK